MPEAVKDYEARSDRLSEEERQRMLGIIDGMMRRADQEALFPAAAAVPFGHREAALAADLCRVVPRARDREFDLAIAACALACDAAFWTLNVKDFRDLPGLTLFEP